MLNFASHIILAWGWRRRGVALLAGACGVLALPPIDFFPAMAIPLTVAVWLIDGAVRGQRNQGLSSRETLASIREAAGAGWWLGLGYFLAGLWWLGAAFLVEADKFLWAMPLGVLGMPVLLALFTALGFALARALWSPGAGRVLALAAGLGAADWLRGVVFTGFPWNPWGMALGGNLALAQIASLIGLHGLTFLAVAIFAAPATLVDGSGDAPAKRSLFAWLRAPVGLALVALAGLAVFGLLRLKASPGVFEAGVKLRLMQPNLPQDEKFHVENKDRILRRYIGLSDKATSPGSTGIADVTHLIWPESAFPFILSRDAATLARLGAMLGETTTLITGAARMGETIRGLPGESRTNYYNSVHVIGRGGVILDTYDKAHLVPFGEYLPFSDLLERLGLRHFVHIPGGFTAAPFRKLLTAPGLAAFAPLVCYEAVFPGEATPNDGKSERPGFLLNVTNDGWFGATFGPWQHFALARLRTIEEGLPLVRAANTGVSAIVDPVGRVLERLPVGVEGVIDGRLPRRIEPTPFSKYPFAGPLALLLLMAAGALVAKARA